MKFAVEAWAPEYGAAAAGEMDDPSEPPALDVEVPVSEWAPRKPGSRLAPSVLFVDGVRRVDANVWIDQSNDLPALGICATYAAGAVRTDGVATLLEARVERGLFTSAAGVEPIATNLGTYEVRAASGATAEELWLAMQQRMGELEREVVANNEGDDLVVADGPLAPGRHSEMAVGYIKTHHVQYLPPALRPVLAALGAGERTPLFLTTTAWSRYMWYLRLPGPADHPLASVVRCEASADRGVTEAAELADLVTVTLPRFASQPHKETRAPQNLYPIGGLERELRRRLGNQALMYRALRSAAR